jgi:hypothetical protein
MKQQVHNMSATIKCVFFITFKYASCIVGTWLFDNTHKTNLLSNVYINIDECMHMFQLLLRLTLI